MAPVAETVPMNNKGREREHQRGKASWMFDELGYKNDIR